MYSEMLDIARSLGAAVAFSANATMTGDGRLVMGCGAAKRIKDAFPGVDLALGNEIRRITSSRPMRVVGDYYFAHTMWCARDGWRTPVIAFQVKRDYRDHEDATAKASCWELCRHSLRELAGRQMKASVPIVINFPLIGAAGFKKVEDDVVRMLIEELGETDVTVCKLDGPLSPLWRGWECDKIGGRGG